MYTEYMKCKVRSYKSDSLAQISCIRITYFINWVHKHPEICNIIMIKKIELQLINSIKFNTRIDL